MDPSPLGSLPQSPFLPGPLLRGLLPRDYSRWQPCHWGRSPKLSMPAFGIKNFITQQQIADVIAYIISLNK